MILFLKEYFKIGKLVASRGLKGELILKHNLGKRSSLKGLTAIFIEERKDSFIPWFISSAKSKSDEEVVVVLETIDTKEKAARLVQKEVWVPEAEMKMLAAKSAPVNLLGYTIVDKARPVGLVLEVIEQPHQLLCRLEIGNKEVLIPLNEQTLQRIDHKQRQIAVDLPDGLIEIYIS